jgi:hypothetical protein
VNVLKEIRDFAEVNLPYFTAPRAALWKVSILSICFDLSRQLDCLKQSTVKPPEFAPAGCAETEPTSFTILFIPANNR